MPSKCHEISSGSCRVLALGSTCITLSCLGSTEQVPGPYWVKVPPLPPSFLAHALHVSGHVAHLPRYGPSHVVTFHIGTSTKLAIPLNRCLLTALSIVVDSLVKRSVRLPKSSAKQGRPSDERVSYYPYLPSILSSAYPGSGSATLRLQAAACPSAPGPSAPANLSLVR